MWVLLRGFDGPSAALASPGGVREVLQALRAAGTAVVALETVAEAPLLSRFSFPPPTTTGGCALLVGNERHGLEAPVLALCDHGQLVV